MALALVRVQGRKPHQGNCVDEYCVSVHTHGADFNSAQKSCLDKEGHLMTVRTAAVHGVLSDLLSGHTGNFWIGLRYMKEICSQSTLELKGYTWINGPEATTFTNWRNSDKVVCSQSCVSLSAEDPTWTERPCGDVTEGYLCEYKNTGTCKRLESEPAVLYETPFGFAREDLQEVPNTSNATDQHLGTKYICFEGQWFKAPWNCEVYKGGCEHECHKMNDTSFCTCLPGYNLEGNKVHCSKAYDGGLCLHADCSQECVVKGKSYACQCQQGYNLGQDGKTCKQIDTCDDKTRCPDENSYCVNTPGGFECRCKSGFIKDQDTCVDYNECFSNPCEHTCNNTIGSYHCECMEGYKTSSADRHECTLFCPEWECLAVNCDLNYPHQCSCPDGFVLEERPPDYVCVDINDCDASLCDHICTNTPGDYNCSCYEGFHLIDKTKCVRKKGFSTTTSISISTPISTPPSIETASLSAGAILGIIVCVVTFVLLMACVIHHYMKRCGKITTDKDYSKDVHALQQVTTEKYVKKQSITNINYN